MQPFLQDILIAYKDIFTAPIKEPTILWQLAPVILLWVIMVWYFGLHKREALGWNTALGNGVSLFWIVISSMQFIFSNEGINFSWGTFAIIGAIMLYGAFIIFASFQHLLSEKVTYLIASPHPIYFLSMTAILYAYNLIQADLPTLIALILLFLFLLGVEQFVKWLMPNEDAKDDTFGSPDDTFGTADETFSAPEGTGAASWDQPAQTDTKQSSEQDYSYLNKGLDGSLEKESQQDYNL